MANNDKKSTLVHDTLCLFIITLVAGLILGGTYFITKDLIAEREVQATNEAYSNVYKGAKFKALSKDDQKKVDAYNKNLEKGKVTTEASKETLTDVAVEEIKTAEKDGKAVGYVAKVHGKGYGGNVVLALGVDESGKIIGVEITDCNNETPGLGQEATGSFKDQYKGKTTEESLKVAVDKDGGDIQSITGATITSRAVTRAINGALDCIASLKK